MKYIIIICVCLLSFNTSLVHAQYLPMSAELTAELNGKRSFTDIMKTVDKYYQEKNYKADKKLFSEYKKWNRWAWYAVRHLNDKGEVDYNSAGYFEMAEKMKAEETTNRNASNSGVWSFLGPYTTGWSNNVGSKGIGRVERIAFHPSNPSIIIVGTPAGGLWKTNDAGLNWYPISSNIPNCGISGIVVSSDDPSGNKIFILTGDGDGGGFITNYGYNRPSFGVLVTYNGGFTWSKCGNSQTVLTGLRCFKLLQVRGTPARLIAGTNNGIYLSNDFGNTWALSDLWGTNVFDLEQHPTNNAVVYAATNLQVWKSGDHGANFNVDPDFTPAVTSATRTALAVTPAAADDVYFLQCGNVNRIYQSVNSGDDFTSITGVNNVNLIGGQYSYNCSFAVSPTTNNNMVVGGITISSSTNNGDSFGNTTMGGINWVPPGTNYVHSDVHDLAFNPSGNLLYAATDGGVFVSSDNGVNWTDRSNGLGCTQYYHMTGFENTYRLLAGGSQDNGTTFTTNGSHMNYCGTGDGFQVSFVSGDNNIFYMVENTDVFRFTRSTNARDSISPGTEANETFYPNVIAHPTNNEIVYVGYSNAIWRSNNKGGSWTNISSIGTSNGGSGHTGGFAVTPAFPNRLYAANATTIRRTDNQGSNWTTISGNAGWPASFGVITDLTCRSNDPDEIWVTMTGNNGANRVFYSPNAGVNWTNFTGSLPNIPIYSIAYDDQGDAYIGTELGVYFMDFFMNDWVPFYNGMPLVPVTDLFINEAFGNLHASTFGRGIWESDLYSDCGPFLFLSGLTTGQQFYQSNGFIETSQEVPGSFGNTLRLRSPQKIIFKNGFRSYNNSYLHAIIGNCGQGIFNLTESPIENTDVESDVMKLQAHKFTGN